MKRLSLFLIASLLSLTMRGQQVDASMVETYTQYIPAVGYVVLTASDDFRLHPQRAITLGTAIVCQSLIVNTMKLTIRELRPDGNEDYHSMPSGHTATAFFGAELVRSEFGPWWGAGAYCIATSVGVLRCVHKRHWWWDALAGAGVGILSARIATWMSETLCRTFGLKTKSSLQLTLEPVAFPCGNSLSATVCPTLSVNF